MFLHAGLLVERKGLTLAYFFKFLQQNSIFHAVVYMHIAGQDMFKVECRKSEVFSSASVYYETIFKSLSLQAFLIDLSKCA
jgi:hypothetical protein